jgi:hypothetical protein
MEVEQIRPPTGMRTLCRGKKPPAATSSIPIGSAKMMMAVMVVMKLSFFVLGLIAT